MCNLLNQYECGHEFVDLGLSVKWATCNIGAETPYEYGRRYAWSKKDPTTANWHGRWRMPTVADFQELLNNCYCQWEEFGDVQGCRFTSTKQGYEDKSIFLRASGLFDIDEKGPYEYGLYWSSNLDKRESPLFQQSQILFFEKGLNGKGEVSIVPHSRNLWANIRPVI